MKTQELRAAFQAVLAADVGVAERDELTDLVAAANRVRAMLDAFDVRCARRSRELAEQGRADPLEWMFGRSGGRSGRDARDISDRTDVSDSLPEFESALNGGEVSAGHLDALASARKGLTDDQTAAFDERRERLLGDASRESVDVFARRCRQLARQIVAESRRGCSDAEELDAQRAASTVKRWTDKSTGMCHTHLELDPLRDAQMWGAIDAVTARLRAADGNARTPWGQLQVNAVVEAVSGDGLFDADVAVDADAADDAVDAVVAGAVAAAVGAANGGAGGVGLGAAKGGAGGADPTARSGRGAARRLRQNRPNVPLVQVLVDVATLVSGLHDRGICETDDGAPLPVSAVRRMCCDAEILPTVMGGDGRPLDVGRSRRTATPEQRQALRAMHRTCAHPGCTVGFSACRIHHVRWWWEHWGPTDLDNLIPLCERHHHLVHEGGWSLTMTPDRVATWTRPDGTVFHTGSTIDRVAGPADVPLAGDEPAGAAPVKGAEVGTVESGAGGQPSGAAPMTLLDLAG